MCLITLILSPVNDNKLTESATEITKIIITHRGKNHYRAFSYDVTASILVFQNKEMVDMLVYQTKPLGIELHFDANFSFCGMKLTWPLVT